MPLPENNILFYWTAPKALLFKKVSPAFTIDSYG